MVVRAMTCRLSERGFRSPCVELLLRSSAPELVCATHQVVVEIVLHVAKSSLLAKEELSISLEAVLRCDLPSCPRTQREMLPLDHTDHARAMSVR